MTYESNVPVSAHASHAVGSTPSAGTSIDAAPVTRRVAHPRASRQSRNGYVFTGCATPTYPFRPLLSAAATVSSGLWTKRSRAPAIEAQLSRQCSCEGPVSPARGAEKGAQRALGQPLRRPVESPDDSKRTRFGPSRSGFRRRFQSGACAPAGGNDAPEPKTYPFRPMQPLSSRPAAHDARESVRIAGSARACAPTQPRPLPAKPAVWPFSEDLERCQESYPQNWPLLLPFLSTPTSHTQYRRAPIQHSCGLARRRCTRFGVGVYPFRQHSYSLRLAGEPVSAPRRTCFGWDNFTAPQASS